MKQINMDASDYPNLPRGIIKGPIKISDGIPDGWAVCDGKYGRPDLSSRANPNLAYVMKE